MVSIGLIARLSTSPAPPDARPAVCRSAVMSRLPTDADPTNSMEYPEGGEKSQPLRSTKCRSAEVNGSRRLIYSQHPPVWAG